MRRPRARWHHLGGRSRGRVVSGTDALRRRRGQERITLSEVADHAVDYARARPDAATALDGFCAFLADLAGTPHQHDQAVAGSTLEPEQVSGDAGPSALG